MALQYSGNATNQTFVQATGTQQEIVTGLQNALVVAGWTVISGLGTANVILESATTPAPQSLVCRVNLFAPSPSGTTTSCKVIFRNQSGSKIQPTGMFLFPTIGKTWRVLANKYQFFIFTSSSPSTSREYASGGVPYLPSFLQGVITECIWSQGNAAADDVNLRSCFRTALFAQVNNQGIHWLDVNLNTYEYAVVNNSYSGFFQLSTQTGTFLGPNQGSFLTPAYMWHDGSLLVYEPLLAWGLTIYSDQGMFRGQMWDAAIASEAFACDQTTTFDTRNWWVLTNNNVGVLGTYARGTLLIVVP